MGYKTALCCARYRLSVGGSSAVCLPAGQLLGLQLLVQLLHAQQSRCPVLFVAQQHVEGDPRTICQPHFRSTDIQDVQVRVLDVELGRR